MGFVTVPDLPSAHPDLDSGWFNVTAPSALPVQGVAFIMGNDIAGSMVRPVFEVLDESELYHTPEVSQSLPDAFPACVHTQAQT